MKHESIIVVYDSCLAMAEKIADKLGAETVSVQSMNIRQVENCQSFVLAVEFMANGQMAPHWQYAFLTFREVSLKGKNFAVMIALGNKHDNGRVVKDAPSHLTYKTITSMQYIFIVSLEFVIAFTGVALLVRYYNHK